jgi:hypothetical protein
MYTKYSLFIAIISIPFTLMGFILRNSSSFCNGANFLWTRWIHYWKLDVDLLVFEMVEIEKRREWKLKRQAYTRY